MDSNITIVSIAVSPEKGTRKTQVSEAELVPGHGLLTDAHAGGWHRQVSFLAAEQIEQARARGLDACFGDFAENIATAGVDWKIVPVGTRVRLGEKALVEITQIGKKDHSKSAAFNAFGESILPREGVFARVLKGGVIRPGDVVRMLDSRALNG